MKTSVAVAAPGSDPELEAAKKDPANKSAWRNAKGRLRTIKHKTPPATPPVDDLPTPAVTPSNSAPTPPAEEPDDDGGTIWLLIGAVALAAAGVAAYVYWPLKR